MRNLKTLLRLVRDEFNSCKIRNEHININDLPYFGLCGVVKTLRDYGVIEDDEAHKVKHHIIDYMMNRSNRMMYDGLFREYTPKDYIKVNIRYAWPETNKPLRNKWLNQEIKKL